MAESKDITASSLLQNEATTSSLAVTTLRLHNFRNYEQLDIALGQGSVVLVGHNGAGKTNILEAISLLVPGRGFRGAKLSELDRQGKVSKPSLYGCQPWSIYAELETPEGCTAIGTGRDAGSDKDKRIVKINGETIRGQRELADYASVCYLIPQMDTTFIDGTTSRRSYLDSLVSIFYPDHTKQLAVYDHAKSERRKLLFQYHADASWLTALEQRMAEQGVAIAAARRETVEQLHQAILQGSSSFPKAMLAVDGYVENLLEEHSALQTEELFAEKLASCRDQDRESGRTTLGVHRSDFVVVHPDKGLVAELCSTGEQKAMMLSITLATAHARKSRAGVAPILLLDEVVAHLDSTRRVELFAELTGLGSQCWLTGTDRALFEGFKGNITFLTVENAVVSA